MSFLNVVLYGSLIAFLLFLAKELNLLGASKGSTKAKNDVRESRRLQKLEHRQAKLMDFYVRVFNRFSNEGNIDKQRYEYLISRSGKKLKYLKRTMTPMEWLGRAYLIMFVSASLGLILFGVTLSPFCFVFFLGFLYKGFMENMIKGKIEKEDREIETHFPSLYMLLYTRLAGENTQRLRPALDDYMLMLEQESRVRDMSAMAGFVEEFRNCIEIYGDDSIALMRLREKYQSVMVINFINLALQAVRGVNNQEKLFSFKSELNMLYKERMRERTAKAILKGNRAVMLIYLILFQFVALSLWAKVAPSLSGLKNIFGIFL